ncbi:hypothetical protein J4225_01630 [Candidatus Pacearchaeota archaeon]|nr:hypothetical protein [Candidatus Pacearchaeota archaeon]
MGILEQVEQMKNQGIPDEQIISIMQQQGITPAQINDALSQTQVKSAIAGPEMEDMQQSIMQQGPYAQSTQELGEEGIPEPGAEYGNAENETYPADSSGYEYYTPQAAGVSTDTMIEVAEQVFTEKISSINKKVEDASEFKTIADTKIEHMEKRLVKLESVIDRINAALLDKISTYGEELSPLKKEMEMVQDSFSKLINPLADKAEKRHAHKKSGHRKSRKSGHAKKTTIKARKK